MQELETLKQAHLFTGMDNQEIAGVRAIMDWRIRLDETPQSGGYSRNASIIDSSALRQAQGMQS